MSYDTRLVLDRWQTAPGLGKAVTRIDRVEWAVGKLWRKLGLQFIHKPDTGIPCKMAVGKRIYVFDI
jgi:hypothetical protein